MPKPDPSIKFRPRKSIVCISVIATEQITIQKIPKKLLSKCFPEFSFFSPDAYAVPGVRGTHYHFYIGSASHGLGADSVEPVTLSSAWSSSQVPTCLLPLDKPTLPMGPVSPVKVTTKHNILA